MVFVLSSLALAERGENMGKHILVIGATLLDTKGKPLAGLEPGTSNPAHIRSTRGGTARNWRSSRSGDRAVRSRR